jgi:hypothetical protein
MVDEFLYKEYAAGTESHRTDSLFLWLTTYVDFHKTPARKGGNAMAMI